MTPPEMTCVVESGKPKNDEERIVALEDCLGREPLRRLQLRHARAERPYHTPATENVPEAMAVAHTTLTPNGIESPDRDARRRPASSMTTPIVFCASFVPCASATSAAPRPDLAHEEAAAVKLRGYVPRHGPNESRVAMSASAARDERREQRGTTTLEDDAQITAPEPTAASPRRDTPPIARATDDDGTLRYHVKRGSRRSRRRAPQRRSPVSPHPDRRSPWRSWRPR